MNSRNLIFCLSLLMLTFSACQPEKSLESQKANFVDNKEKFYKVKVRLENIVNDDMMCRVTIDENNSDQFSISIGKMDSINKRMRFPFKVWENLDLKNKNLPNILKVVNWTDSDIKYILKNLKQINCEGVISADLSDSLSCVKFIYGNGKSGEFRVYMLFDKEQAHSMKNNYEGKSGFFVYNDSVIFKTTYW